MGVNRSLAVLILEIMPPLVLFGTDGKYAAAAEEVFSGI